MKKSNIKSEEKKNFIKELRALEEVQNFKKMKERNILICILLILITPIVVLLGLYFNLILSCIIGGIILTFVFIYIFMNEYKCKKIVTKLILENIISFFNTNYAERKISQETQEEICEKINKLFNVQGLDNCVEHLTRFVKDDKYVDLVSYTEEEYQYGSGTLHFFNFILACKIKENGLFYLTCTDRDVILRKNRVVYDRIFGNYKKYIIRMLKEMGEKPQEEEYIELTEVQKKKLVEIYNKYPNHFTILIKDGYVYIKMRKFLYTSIKCLEEILDFENCLNDLLLNFI